MSLGKLALPALLGILLGGCSATQTRPLEPVEHVDLDRFMGDWYVLANIPTFLERDAHNAVESYRLNDDGTVATTFTFREGDFDGEQKTYTPTGFVIDTRSNAVWGMQFLWPFKADYRIIYLDEDYRLTVIGRNQRDYVWIMGREPRLEEAEYRRMEQFLAAVGYDTRELQRVPQRWP